MKKYELVCLLDSQLGDEGFESMVTKLEGQLADAGAEVVNIDRWGLRKLAYTSVTMKRRQQAYYVLYQFTAPVGAFDDLQRELMLDEGVLRHLLVAVDGEFMRVPQLESDTVYIRPRDDRHFRGRGRGRFERPNDQRSGGRSAAPAGAGSGSRAADGERPASAATEAPPADKPAADEAVANAPATDAPDAKAGGDAAPVAQGEEEASEG